MLIQGARPARPSEVRRPLERLACRRALVCPPQRGAEVDQGAHRLEAWWSAFADLERPPQARQAFFAALGQTEHAPCPDPLVEHLALLGALGGVAGELERLISIPERQRGLRGAGA